jgi:AcrR family transcriptional regulator
VTRSARGPAVATSTASAPGDGSPARRDEILETASKLFASRGLRTSLQEIAEACGIKPGSLYHHFDSKEAIVVELVERYHAELDRVAERAHASLAATRPADVTDRIVAFGTAIAECAVRHSVAVHFSFNEPPAGAGPDLVETANKTPQAIQAVMAEALEIGRAGGVVRSGVDLGVLADRLCQTMLHVGLGFFHRYADVDRVAVALCRILLDGLATATPKASELDRSSALVAVEDVVKRWYDDDDAGTDKAAYICSIARAEFGRRGYEVTTIRDIASAAGMSTGSVYRVIGSKEELLASIMRSFFEKSVAGWDAAFDAPASPVEKLDAVAWLHINVMDRFNEEFKIQLAWLRQSPPETIDLGWSFAALMRRLKALLRDGERSGALHVDDPSAELVARCVVELTWVPENIIHEAGMRAALKHQRDTVLRGVTKR